MSPNVDKQSKPGREQSGKDSGCWHGEITEYSPVALKVKQAKVDCFSYNQLHGNMSATVRFRQRFGPARSAAQAQKTTDVQGHAVE